MKKTKSHKNMNGKRQLFPMLALHSLAILFLTWVSSLERGKEKVSVTVLSRCKCSSHNPHVFRCVCLLLLGRKQTKTIKTKNSPASVCLCLVFARAINIMAE